MLSQLRITRERRSMVRRRFVSFESTPESRENTFGHTTNEMSTTFTDLPCEQLCASAVSSFETKGRDDGTAVDDGPRSQRTPARSGDRLPRDVGYRLQGPTLRRPSPPLRVWPSGPRPWSRVHLSRIRVPRRSAVSRAVCAVVVSARRGELCAFLGALGIDHEAIPAAVG